MKNQVTISRGELKSLFIKIAGRDEIIKELRKECLDKKVYLTTTTMIVLEAIEKELFKGDEE